MTESMFSWSVGRLRLRFAYRTSRPPALLAITFAGEWHLDGVAGQGFGSFAGRSKVSG